MCRSAIHPHQRRLTGNSTDTRAVYVILRAKVTYSLDREEITGALIARQVRVHLQSGVEGAMAQRL